MNNKNSKIADWGCLPLAWSGSGSTIQDLSRSWCIKGNDGSTLGMDSSVSFMHKTDLGSLILIQINPKECTLEHKSRRDCLFAYTYAAVALIISLHRMWINLHIARVSVVQSLNSPFFWSHIGAEPGRAKEESRITCMRMLRTPPFFPPNRGKNHIWKY